MYADYRLFSAIMLLIIIFLLQVQIHIQYIKRWDLKMFQAVWFILGRRIYEGLTQL